MWPNVQTKGALFSNFIHNLIFLMKILVRCIETEEVLAVLLAGTEQQMSFLTRMRKFI